jgi:hypothetical protein
MGLDLSVEESPPILFETAILSVSTEVMGRWSTFEEAMKEHGAAVERCQLAYALAMKG